MSVCVRQPSRNTQLNTDVQNMWSLFSEQSVVAPSASFVAIPETINKSMTRDPHQMAPHTRCQGFTADTDKTRFPNMEWNAVVRLSRISYRHGVSLEHPDRPHILPETHHAPPPCDSPRCPPSSEPNHQNHCVRTPGSGLPLDTRPPEISRRLTGIPLLPPQQRWRLTPSDGPVSRPAL